MNELTSPVDTLGDEEFPFEKLTRMTPQLVGPARSAAFLYAPIAAMAPTGLSMPQRFIQR